MKKRFIKSAFSLVLSLLAVALAYYIKLPPLNGYSKEFWLFTAFALTVIAAPIAFILSGGSWGDIFFRSTSVSKKKKKSTKLEFKLTYATKLTLVLTIGIPVAVIIIGGIFSSAFFNAKNFAEIVTVEEGVFADDMPQSTAVTNIALMDTASATVLGDRTLGALSEVVSQYELSTTYTQINYRGAPQKVSQLEYADFFKWLNNRANGVPGYAMVDPVHNTAEYCEFETPLKYVESAYFGEDLKRKLRFSYPTKIFHSVYFEIDESGAPYFIISCVEPQVCLFGAYDVTEVILFDPCSGNSELCDVKNTPSWIDIVYTGDLACEKYNWHGLYLGGFWNSVIGNVNCKQTTDDFGYIVIGDDVWFFTGVTSLSSDASNIGFLISNARTGEYKFYPVVGAEEHSAMSAAQGEVQEKGYVASFPSLVNISGEATYIMVLKDDYGLVKLYALVNVEQYNIVATGTTQREAMEAYDKLLRENGIEITAPILPDGDVLQTEITVENIRIIDVYGTPTVYITADDGNVYKSLFTADESLILIRAGDRINVVCSKTEIDGIFDLISWNSK